MKCSKCKIVSKDGEGFMKYAKNKKGTQYYYCKECNTERAKKYRTTKIGAENTRKAVAKSIKKYPEKQKVRMATHYFLVKGKIQKANKCQECNSKETLFIHHNNYDDAFDILWLCKNCHYKKHKIL